MSGKIKKLYKSAGKCNYQKHYKAILDVAMVSTPKELTDNSPTPQSQSVTVKQPSKRNSLHQFLEAFDDKPNNFVCGLYASK